MQLITAPAVEPWRAADAEVGLALKLDGGHDAAYVDLCIAAARRHFERVTGLCLINQVWTASFDALPEGREIAVPRAPIVSVASVTWLNDQSVSATINAGDYAVGGVGHGGTFGRIRLRTWADWPGLGDVPDALRITFTAGFGTAANDVPQDIRLGLLQLVAWWYEQRLPVNVGNIVNELPFALTAIINSHRVAHIG
jgi:uncharacterized phiE125 gp8 family phage protein